MEKEEHAPLNSPEDTGKYIHANYFQDENERAVKRIHYYEEFLNTISENEQAQAWLSQFHPDSVKTFLLKYADARAEWLTEHLDFKGFNENNSIQYIEEAFDRLVEIQQKKLFDLQCLWRAEKIVIPEVEICFDFLYWEQRVMNCPFLDPVTPEDIALYQQYLRSGRFEEEQPLMCHWQDYDDLKEAYEETEEMERGFPEWFHFHTEIRGTGFYMALPNIRGEKEQKYIDLYFAEAARNRKPEPEGPPPDLRPYLSFYPDEQKDIFVEMFEDDLSKQYYEAYKKNSIERDEESWEEFPYYIDWIVEELEMAAEKIAVEAAPDYRRALLKARDSYKWNKIAEAMTSAYDRYLLHQEIGLKHNETTSLDRISFTAGWRKTILRGRELCGEPADFNF